MHLTTVVMVALLCGAPEGLARHEPLALRAAAPNAESVPCYGLLELKVDLSATYDNPFDPEDVDLGATFVSPDGTTFRVAGFLAQDCTRRLENGGERIEPAGTPFWLIRFSPNREGTWRYRVSLKDRSGQTELPEAAFTAAASPSPGMVRRNAQSPHVFAFDNGKPYFAIGENMCWPGARGTYDYEDWLPQLSQAGGNWIRIWMHRWNCCLEWSGLGKPDWETTSYYGLGVYNLTSAWKLDTILDFADKNDVYVMLCLGTYGEFINGGYFGEGLWDKNPYNAANGGPCEKPEDFWTNEQARKLYRQRLRYISARYGWRSHLFAWEFWNEAHPTPEWMAEMAAYLKGTGAYEGQPADPYRHLVSTTYGTPEIWKLADVDFSQTHHYGKGDIPDSAPVILADAQHHREFGKPHLMAEFGIDWRSSDDKYDPDFLGVNLHNGIWASALSGNGGGAMLWYWDSYVHPGKVFNQFAPLRSFADTIPWQEGPWNTLQMDPPALESDPGTRSDLAIAPTRTWEKDPLGEFTLGPVPDSATPPVPTFLFGPTKPELQTPLTLHTNYEKGGRFDLRINTVSSSAKLVISLDGAVALEKTLSAVPPEKGGPAPEYVETAFKPEYGLYQASFDKAYGIDVPAGEHTLRVDVTDGDWVSIAQYVFRGYLSDRYPRVNSCGITNGNKAYIWLQNAGHNWLNRKNGAVIPPVANASTTIRGLTAGRYICKWWDTWKGEVTSQTTLTCENGNLVLPIPELATDRAVAIEPELAK